MLLSHHSQSCITCSITLDIFWFLGTHLGPQHSTIFSTAYVLFPQLFTWLAPHYLGLGLNVLYYEKPSLNDLSKKAFLFTLLSLSQCLLYFLYDSNKHFNKCMCSLTCLLPVLHCNTSLIKARSLVYSPLWFWGLVQYMEWNSFQMLNDAIGLKNVTEMTGTWTILLWGKCLETWTWLLCAWFLCPTLIFLLTPGSVIVLYPLMLLGSFLCSPLPE